jgi:glycine dehydrogenase subunit 1
MLRDVGVEDVMGLYEEIPDALRFKGRLDLPEPIPDEYSIKRHVEKILAKNKNCTDFINFLGAGCARHFVPAVCDEITGRGELLTAYGAENWADHGKHQIFFEYQSLMAELLDMDFLTVPCHDGAQAVATSLRMVHRINGRNKVLLPKSMNPQHLAVARNYLASAQRGKGLKIELVDFDPETGLLDIQDLKNKISPDVAAVLIENPCFLGIVEVQAEEIGKIARAAGAEFIVYTDPISLGVMEAPANYGATLAIGDIQSLGLHLMGGGALGGFIASFDDMTYMMEFKELVNGLTETEVEGEYGFGVVLIERTHYAMRENGREFTGTQNNLWTVPVSVYLSLMGPKGMEEVGTTIMQNAQYAYKKLAGISGVGIKFKTPFFKEFVLNFDKTGKSVADINKALLAFQIFGGWNLAADFPELGQSSLFCVTEVHTKEDIDQLADALQSIVSA